MSETNSPWCRAWRSCRPLAGAVALALLFGCGDGGSDALDKTVVTALPDGDAMGSFFAGSYDLTITTKSCVGSCPTVTGAAGAAPLCQSGASETRTVSFKQRDGHLTVDFGPPYLVGTLEGGVSRNGPFDVGAYATANSGAVELTARATGWFDFKSNVAGTLIVRGTGAVDGVSVGCTANHAFSGKK